AEEDTGNGNAEGRRENPCEGSCEGSCEASCETGCERSCRISCRRIVECTAWRVRSSDRGVPYQGAGDAACYGIARTWLRGVCRWHERAVQGPYRALHNARGCGSRAGEAESEAYRRVRGREIGAWPSRWPRHSCSSTGRSRRDIPVLSCFSGWATSTRRFTKTPS